MRVNILKWLFLIFVVGIMIFAIQKINQKESNEEEKNITTNADQVIVNKELKLGIADFDTINPILTKNKYVQDITKIIYEPLVKIDKDYRVQPGLALEWAKNGDKTYIIKLRENIKWSDGTEITANDVLYTIEKIKTLDTIYSEGLKNITGYDALNNYMVKITVQEEIPHFEYYLNFPILSKAYYGEDDFSSPTKNNAPVASGKYKIVYNANDIILLEKNENYYLSEEENLIIEKINVNLYSSVGEMYNAFKLGQVDILTTNNLQIEDYIGTIGYNKKEFAGREYDFLAINTQNNILQDVIVRQALNYSINKQQIVNDIFYGKYFVSNFPLDFGNWIYEKQESTIEYNKEKAKQLLEEDGWTYQYGSWQKYEDYRTKKLNFRLLVDGSNVKRVHVAEKIKEQLAESGIIINIVKLTGNQYNYMAFEAKNYDLLLCGSNLSTSIDLGMYLGDNNFANYYNEELANLINEVKNIKDEEVLKEKYKRIIQIYNTEVPYISLYNNYTIIAYSPELSGNIESSWYSMFYNIEEWHK